MAANKKRMDALCGGRVVPGKPGAKGMKTGEIKEFIDEKLPKNSNLHKEYKRGKKDRVTLCGILTKFANGKTLLNLPNSPPKKKKAAAAAAGPSRKSWYEMTEENGNSSASAQSAQSNNGNNALGFVNYGNSNNEEANEPRLGGLSNRVYTSRKANKDPLKGAPKLGPKLKPKTNRALRARARKGNLPAVETYGDALKKILAISVTRPSTRLSAMANRSKAVKPAKRAKSASSGSAGSTGRSAAKRALKGTKSAGDANRRSKFQRHRKRTPLLKMKAGNGRVVTRSNRGGISTTKRPPLSKFQVREAWANATARAEGMRIPKIRINSFGNGGSPTYVQAFEGPGLPSNEKNYQRLRTQFMKNATAKMVPPRRSPPGSPLVMRLANNVYYNTRIAMLKKAKKNTLTKAELKELKWAEKFAKLQKKTQKKGPTVAMKTGAKVNIEVEEVERGSSKKSQSTGSPNKKIMAVYSAAAAKARAAGASQGPYTRPKKRSPPKKAPAPAKKPASSERQTNLRKLMEQIQEGQKRSQSVRGMVAREHPPYPYGIVNKRGQGWYSQ